MKKWQFWLGATISAIFLFIALRGLKPKEFWLALSEANYWWLIPGVLVYLLTFLARTWRWRYLLRPVRAISLAHLFPVIVIGFWGNNIYPARAGEIIRTYVLKKKEGISISTSLATVFVERTFDGVALLLFVFVSLPFIPLQDWLNRIVLLASFLFFGALAVSLAIAAKPSKSQALYNRLIVRLFPRRLRAPILSILDHFLEGLRPLHKGRDMLIIFAISLLIWLMMTVEYWFVALAFHEIKVAFYVLMLMNGVMSLSASLPAGPGYLGTFDLPGIEILKALDVPAEIAVSYILILHATIWFPITALGTYYIYKEGISWKAKLNKR